MKTDSNAWPEIRKSLSTAQDTALEALLDSASVSYDGVYTLSADNATYTGLCHVYPLLETVVQDKTGKHLRLSLNTSVPMGTVDRGLDISLGASSITDAIVVPESIIAIPSYLLRFVPYVGSAAVLIATALRQAFYRSSRERGADQLYPRNGDTVSIQVEAILETLGNTFSRAKFFRVFKEGGLDWFVQRGEASHRVKNGQVQRLPTQYRYRGMLLTPGDASDLYTWLLDNHLSRDPIEVLTRASNVSRDQILNFPFRLPDDPQTARFSQPVAIAEVVQAVLNESSLKLNATLIGLCDRLATHLIRPESFLAMPHYWFRNVLPELGDDLGMLYLMSKNCCYIDWARGKDRNTFWVSGGLPTLQGWIRSETLPRRIPAEQESQRGRPRSSAVKTQSVYTRNLRENQRDLASACLCRVKTRPSETVPGGTDWQLRVSDIGLTARDETIKQAIYAFLFAPPDGVNHDNLIAYFDNVSLKDLLLLNAQAHPTQLCHYETLVSNAICQNETLCDEEICHYETLVNGLNYYFETLIEAGICQFDTILNILSRLDTPIFLKTDTSAPDTDLSTHSRISQFTSQSQVVGYYDHDLWDFEKLLSGISPLLKKRILAQNAEKAYLSWLIYASLTAGIQNPVSLAVKRTLESNTDTGGAAFRLANLPAYQLAQTLASALTRLERGYLGGYVVEGVGAADLLALLGIESPQENQTILLRRLADALGVQA
ncbi:MAG: hypothetical protein WBI14_03565 [Anaerolineaceae bacterium]